MKHFNHKEETFKQFIIKILLNIFYLKNIKRRIKFILDALRNDDNS